MCWKSKAIETLVLVKSNFSYKKNPQESVLPQTDHVIAVAHTRGGNVLKSPLQKHKNQNEKTLSPRRKQNRLFAFLRIFETL